MRKALIITCTVAALLTGAGAASAEEENRVKRDAKQAGHEMKSGIFEFGRGMRDAAKGVGQDARNLGKEVGKTAKDAPKDVADGVKHGDKRKTGRANIERADP